MYATHKTGFVHHLRKCPQIWREIFVPAHSCTLYELILTFFEGKCRSREKVVNNWKRTLNVQDNRERMSKFLRKKDAERAEKDSLARQQALERLPR